MCYATIAPEYTDPLAIAMGGYKGVTVHPEPEALAAELAGGVPPPPGLVGEKGLVNNHLTPSFQSLHKLH